MFRFLARARFAALALICAGACTSSGAATVHPAATPTTANRFPAVVLQMSGDAPAAVVDGVHRALDAYVAAATVDALKTGHASDLTPIFTADALPGATGGDRATVVDEGIAGVVSLRSSTGTAAVSSIADQVASVKLDLTVVALVGAVPVTIHRTGELALVADAGSWRVDSYDLKVSRDSQDAPAPAATTPTTAGKP